MLRRASGFTLVELLVTLLLAALLATGTTLSVRAVLRDARLRDAVGRTIAFDALARDRARRLGQPLQLAFSAGTDHAARLSAASGEAAGADLQLPPGVLIERVMTPGDSADRAEVRLPCSPAGLTPSYAVLLSGGGDRRRWIVLAGMTGRTYVTQDDAEISDIFAAIARNDAD